MPLSWFTEHDLSAVHMPPTCATPSVLHGVFRRAQMSTLVMSTATSWWCGSASSAGLICAAQRQKEPSVLSAFTVELNVSCSSCDTRRAPSVWATSSYTPTTN